MVPVKSFPDDGQERTLLCNFTGNDKQVAQ